jgi:cell division protein FtsL
VISPDDAQSLTSWLQGWAEHLAEKSPGAPLIRPAKRPLSAGKLRAVALMTSLAAILVCAAHHLAMQHHKRNLVVQTESLAEPRRELDSLDKQADDLNKERETLHAEVATLRGNLTLCDRVLETQQRRFARLLGALAEQGPKEIVVLRIEGSGDGVAIEGICLRPELANQLAAELDEAVRPLGWQSEPPDKQAQELLVDGGPWKFEIHLHDIPDWQGDGENPKTVAAIRR